MTEATKSGPLKYVRPTRRALALAVLLLLSHTAAADCVPDSSEIGAVEKMYDGALPPDIAVNTYRNIGRLFPTRKVQAGTRAAELPHAAAPLSSVNFVSNGKHWDLVDYLAVNRVAGLLVLKDGKIAYETYQLGNTERTCWMSMSVAKSLTSTLIGAAIKDGYIKSIDDPVTAYVPKLSGTVYEGVSIRDVLMMSSGVQWNETYTDPRSDRRRLLAAQLSQRPGAALEVMRSLRRKAPAGTVNTYSTGETQVAGEVLFGAIHKPLAEYLSEKIWKPVGMESSASWWLTAPSSIEVAGSGFSATLRDYGRFGLFFLNGGSIDGRSILPDGWTTEAGSPKTLKDGKSIRYGYFWWPAWPTEAHPDPGAAFSAIGIFGQYIYINPVEQLVVVVWSARSKPEGMDVIDDMDFFAAVAAKLH